VLLLQLGTWTEQAIEDALTASTRPWASLRLCDAVSVVLV
jgi:hypothetical protein